VPLDYVPHLSIEVHFRFLHFRRQVPCGDTHEVISLL
jgi:hypothetical protein